MLLQVVFHARIGADRRAFGIDDVARGIADKLVRRHPHVFADGDATTPAEVQATWDELKQVEKSREGPFDGVPVAGPGLELLGTLQRKAAKLGLDRFDASGPLEQLQAELAALEAAADDDAREAGFGDVLDTVVALARHLDVDPEVAARHAARRFRSRVEAVLARVAATGDDPRSLDAASWSRHWQSVLADELD